MTKKKSIVTRLIQASEEVDTLTEAVNFHETDDADSSYELTITWILGSTGPSGVCIAARGDDVEIPPDIFLKMIRHYLKINDLDA